MEHKRSTRDIHEIHQNEHDEANAARRVVIVGGGKVDIQVDTSKVSESISEALKGIKLDIPEIKIPESSGETKIEVIEVPVQTFVPQVETKIIEVPKPIITTEYKVVEIEKPIVTEVLKTIEIEKPVITEKVVEKVPAWAWSLIISQTMAVIGGLLYYYLGR